MKKSKTRPLFAILACLSMLLANQVQAQDNDDLQKVIDRLASAPVTRASSTVTDIDLSAYSTPRTTTLYIRNGVNVRFVNGTLTRSTSFTDGPLITIQTDSQLELSATSALSGNNVYTSHSVVNVENGILTIKGGKICDVYGWANPSASSNGNTAVELSGGNDAEFLQYSGEVLGRIDNKSGGYLSIQGGIVYRVSTSESFRLSGNAVIKANVYFYKQTASIRLYYSLKNTLRLSNYEKDQLVLTGDSRSDTYGITTSDVEKLELGGNDNNYTLSLEGNSVYVRENKLSPIQTIENVEPGTLPNRIPEKARDIIEELTITGKLNGTDIVLLQDMAKKKLRKLNISGCDIVKGGSAYYTSSETNTQCYTANDEIGCDMFYKSTSLETVILPNSIAKLNGSSFHYGSVKSITIGPKVKTIDGGLCPGANIEEIILNNNSSFILDGGILYDAKKTTIYRAVVGVSGEINIPNNITTIENSAFDNCSHITKVTLPSKLTEIQTACFSDCTAMTEVVFNNNLSYLGYNCFSGCNSLKTVDLRNTKVYYIYQSFYNCNNIETLLLPSTIETIWGTCFTSTHLNYISCPAVIPPTLSHADITFMYSYIKSFCKVVVPTKSITAYKTADGWKNFLKYESDKDPNYIESEDDLQKRLDEIAAQNPKDPVTLTIRKEGITLTNLILAESGCKAIITGGKITATETWAKHADLLFGVHNGADITFRKITLQFPNLRANDCYHFITSGTLTFDSAVFVVDKLTISGECRIYGYTQLPMLYLSAESRIRLLSPMQYTWTIDADWSHFNVEDPYTIVSGYNYTVTKADYSRMQFANLPDNLETVYNESSRVVQLQKRTKECDLQSLVDGLCNMGSGNCEGDACVIPVPEDVVDIGCWDDPDPLQCAVDKELDGKKKKEDEPDDPGIILPPQLPIICMCCACPSFPTISQEIRVSEYSSLTIRNFNIKGGKYENQHIVVRGTLIIDVNVYIYRFIRFIHIMRGGRVIWRGGHVEDVDEIVYNEGGTLEIEGDFDNGGKRFVNPEGCTLIIRKGTFHGDIENHGTLIIEGGEINGEIWSDTDIKIDGSVQVTDIHIKRGCRIYVTGRLRNFWNIHFYQLDDFDIYVPFIIGDDGYQLSEDDFSRIQIELPAGYRWVYYKGTIVIVRIPYDVYTIVEYLNYFGPQGLPGYPWSFVYNLTNIDINTDWYILRDYHLIFDGGTFTMGGGDIYINEGASQWLKNIRFKGSDRHIYVYGTLYIDENVDFAEIFRFIHICRGGKIHFVTQPTYTINIYIGEEHIVTGEFVILDVKQEWLQFLNIELPNGYEWEYDKTRQAIIIKGKTIDSIRSIVDDSDGHKVYNLQGQRVSKMVKGQLYVRDGKKVLK